MKGSIDTKSSAWREILQRTQEHSRRSSIPVKFLNDFEDEMRVLVAEGETEMLALAPSWHDPVHLAAEVEALCAFRAAQRSKASKK